MPRRIDSSRIQGHTTLKPAGGSLVMTVPAIVRKRLNLVSGTELAVMVEGTRMVVEAIRPSPENIQVRRPKYTLDELLAGAEPSESMSDEESAWHDEAPKGREVW